ncbi:arsenic resistance N-acetyltransferase ArsN2 [Marilutibacter aestuarii]|uniref:GNAT family N-acetyltransferase n=1 Tax=Marilutibacter aestuarii TaxID=1706195 RepID=A0A508AI49_9GAMM|nr:arsenic resistance N-acetyltransferase ArsN2 [Lysobacter aestuarii]TQD45362.1 GNAT family N-acetyltransferase [Lysobacter aestuarii]
MPPTRPGLIEAINHDAAVEALLAACDLDASDLQESSAVLFGHVADGALQGLVGLEMHGNAALLRSLAVAAEARGRGLGEALVDHAEREATARGLERLFLLTTTATGFFQRLGYRTLAREDAPPGIVASTQFASLCPASASFMAKTLPGNDNG